MRVTSNTGVQGTEGVSKDSAVTRSGGRFLGTKALEDVRANWTRTGDTPVYANSGSAGRAATVDTSLRA